MADKQFPCGQCGAKVKFDPRAAALKCPYCGHENAIPKSASDIKELDFHTYLQQAGSQAEQIQTTLVRCSGCGSEISVDPQVQSELCPFCDSAFVTGEKTAAGIKPESLLPFQVERKKAVDLFHKWAAGLWFAPNKLKHYARTTGSRLAGMYVPYWTYDANTTSWYQGERGDDYQEQESYTEIENGERVEKTRTVTRTRWTSVSGVVYESFDDVLVVGSSSIPLKQAERLEPWDLENLVGYDASYLSGFRTERYQVDLGAGFERAKQIMDTSIRAAVNRDIGGDHQRISSISTQHDNITFKHILLPLWISAYRLGEKTYRFLVNARTGEVQGERPWSVAKIIGAIVGAAALIGIISFLVYYFQQQP